MLQDLLSQLLPGVIVKLQDLLPHLLVVVVQLLVVVVVMLLA